MPDLSEIQQAIQKFADKAVQDQAGSGPDKGAANVEDIQKLQAELSQPPTDPAAAQVQATDKVAEAKASDYDSLSPGAKVLDHMNNLRTSFDEAMQELHTAVADSDASPSAMMKVQVKLQQVTLQQDLLGKVVSKSEQNIDTLLKGQ